MPHGGGKVTGQWTIPPPRPRWGGWGLSLIGALDLSVFCMGGSKELAVLPLSCNTVFTDENTIVVLYE